jgi:hypothetical protein
MQSEGQHYVTGNEDRSWLEWNWGQAGGGRCSTHSTDLQPVNSDPEMIHGNRYVGQPFTRAEITETFGPKSAQSAAVRNAPFNIFNATIEIYRSETGITYFLPSVEDLF